MKDITTNISNFLREENNMEKAQNIVGIKLGA